MTTIAANRKSMAADRKCSHRESNFRSIKMRVIGGAIVGGAGDDKHISTMFRWIEGGMSADDAPTFKKEDEFDVLVLTPAGLFLFGNDTTAIEIQDPFYAVGSGTHAALAAMHLGATPKRAVEIACLVDNNTGGPVDALTLKA